MFIGFSSSPNHINTGTYTAKVMVTKWLCSSQRAGDRILLLEIVSEKRQCSAGQRKALGRIT